MNARHLGGEEWRDLGRSSEAAAEGAGIVRRARENIERIRKTDAEIRLQDGTGRPVAGVPVELELQQHAFLFGCEVWELDALIRDGRGDTDRARAWRQRFRAVFNASTNLCYWTERPRNDASKTEDRHGEPRLENFAATVEWSLAEGLTPKGHPLFWSIPKCIPDWALRYDTATLMRMAEARVRGLVARFRGRIRLWDAVNEPLWEAAPANLARRHWPHIEPVPVMADYIAEVLRWCREEDPDACYLVNDYGLEGADQPARVGSDGSRVTPAAQRRRFLELFAELEQRGAAPDAMGLQSHTAGWISPAEQWAVYDELAQAGRPLHITEFWAALSDAPATLPSEEERRRAQAEYVANHLTCAFGHPAVAAFFFWDFMKDALNWTDALSGHETTPLYETVRRLIHEEWHTRLRTTTDDRGCVKFRGFYGRYALRRLDGARPIGRTFELTPAAPAALTLRF